MSIALHTEPVYALACNNCDTPAEVEGEGHLWRFDSPELARDWAHVNGWTGNAHTTLCPPCTAEAREREDHAQEIAAAVQYATEGAR
ncbi:hypothetical protein ACFUJX_19845 [Streptomyces rubiginosohelvolus]|uniref:hypothetical protein n=1 Tax=Streptomyces rubiginosohelvolus TaxID=67362 RepID=UPI00362963E0